MTDNIKSVGLIKQIYQPNLKPSQILELADQTKVKQIRNKFNDHQCGYCARGFISQFLAAGEFDYWHNTENLWDKRNDVLKLKDSSLDYNFADIKLVALTKYKKRLDELTFEQKNEVFKIVNRIQTLNDNGLTFKQIAEKLEEIGL